MLRLITSTQNIFGIVNEISNHSQHRVDIVSSSSIGSSYLIYVAIAFAGFYTYGEAVNSNILINYPSEFYVKVPLVYLLLTRVLFEKIVSKAL